MRLLTGPKMHDVYEVAQAVNELAEGYDYLLDAVQRAEPHALADVAALREENERLRARVTELESPAPESDENGWIWANHKQLCDENDQLRAKVSRLRARIAELESAAESGAVAGRSVTREEALRISKETIACAEAERLRERLEAEQLRSETFADLEAQACEENARLRARIAELEPAAANWALVEAIPRGARLEHDLKPSDWEWTAWLDTCDWFACRTPATALRAALGKGEGE